MARNKHIQAAPFFFIKEINELCENAIKANKIPHAHDYYSIVFITKGEATHSTNWVDYTFGDNTLLFVTTDLIHRFSIHNGTEGYMLYFNREFFNASGLGSQEILHSKLFINPENRTMVNFNDEDRDRFIAMVKQIQDEFTHDDPYKNEIIYHLLMQLMLTAKRIMDESDEEPAQESQKDAVTLMMFKQLIEDNYRNSKDVSFYADMLNMQPSCLNATSKKLTGITAGEFIRNRIIEEAKRYLHHSNLSKKEIGWKLGFEDPAYFSRFFKKYTGQTLSQYRKLISNKKYNKIPL